MIQPNSIHGLGADPTIHAAVDAALGGDSAPLTALTGKHLSFATRSLSLLLAAQVRAAMPGCALGGFTFWLEEHTVTFTPQPGTNPGPVQGVCARMLAVDATALHLGEHTGTAHHEMWQALWQSAPPISRPTIAALLVNDFSTAPTPHSPIEGDLP